MVHSKLCEGTFPRQTTGGEKTFVWSWDISGRKGILISTGQSSFRAARYIHNCNSFLLRHWDLPASFASQLSPTSCAGPTPQPCSPCQTRSISTSVCFRHLRQQGFSPFPRICPNHVQLEKNISDVRYKCTVVHCITFCSDSLTLEKRIKETAELAGKGHKETHKAAWPHWTSSSGNEKKSPCLGSVIPFEMWTQHWCLRYTHNQAATIPKPHFWPLHTTQTWNGRNEKCSVPLSQKVSQTAEEGCKMHLWFCDQRQMHLSRFSESNTATKKAREEK